MAETTKRLNNHGVAILVSLFMLFIVSFLVIEITGETKIEYIVTSQEYQRLKSYYAAKAGLKLSLLRIRLYQRAMDQYAKQLEDNPSMIDFIWQLPLVWPIEIPSEGSIVDRENVSSITKETFMDSKYIATTASEGGRIDLNDLASPSEKLAEIARKQLLKLLENFMDANDDWSRDYRGLSAEEIVNNITDWVDKDSEGRNSGDERAPYADLKSEFIPPNRPFRTLEELRMVDGVTDEIFDILSGQVTVYGLKGINVNYADKEVLKAIDEEITEEVADEILKRRNDPEQGPFKGLDDFKAFLEAPPNNVNLDELPLEELPLYFDPEYNFKVSSIGSYGKTLRKIEAIIYDTDVAQTRLEKFLVTSTTTTTTGGPPSTGGSNGSPSSTTTSTTSTTKTTRDLSGPPTIVYWQED
jgi:general secretion pathway protein K